MGSLHDWWQSVAAIAARFTTPGLRRVLVTDPAPVYVLSSVDAFVDFLGRAEELGFTEMTVPWPRASGPWAGDEAIVERVAAAIPRQHETPD